KLLRLSHLRRDFLKHQCHGKRNDMAAYHMSFSGSIAGTNDKSQSTASKKLADRHVNYESAKEFPLK
ncbi:MAG TPA: hypothetical protein VF437_01045, partial [Verrucomicrobiae bacterium]